MTTESLLKGAKTVFEKKNVKMFHDVFVKFMFY